MIKYGHQDSFLSRIFYTVIGPDYLVGASFYRFDRTELLKVKNSMIGGGFRH